jgi:penicillin-binding protein-related factor A (putative recombinase)
MREHDVYPVLEDLFCRLAEVRLVRLHDRPEYKNPFDHVGVCPDGVAVCIETKVVRGRSSAAESVPLSLFKPHQQTWLKAWQEAGARALAVVYFEKDDTMLVVRLQCDDWSNPMSKYSGQLQLVSRGRSEFHQVLSRSGPVFKRNSVTLIDLLDGYKWPQKQ